MRIPRLTSVVLLLTSVLTGLQFANPEILAALQRSPAVLHGEPWRLLTAFFIERGTWIEIAANLAGVAVIGATAETVWRPRRWMIIYLLGGLTGEIAGLAWRPYGAGSSVAVCGLIGALAAARLSKSSWPVRVSAIALLLVGVALTAARNLHGPPIVVTMLVAYGWKRDIRVSG
jgi:rhomboid protease GluP